jgi:hypothetical protein
MGPGAAGARPARRQKPFEGSARQRRGRLLRRVLAEGAVALDEEDRPIAVGLVRDGLAVLSRGRLAPPR